ncbi:MAG: TRAP transporter large permease subunit [Sphingomonadales bacterium]|jgi:tripartite ATP-independent transporter DctM subunit
MAAPYLLSFLLIFLLSCATWIGLALLGGGVISLHMLRDMNISAFLAGDIWRSLNAAELAALPLFIWMGEILFRTKISSAFFEGLSPFLKRMPGQHLHVNILACTLFAAASGSSAATTATIGRITLDELEKRGYDRDLAMGSLCGAGTLGFLIPPSIILILYGVLADISIIDLFIAGLLPGLLLAGAAMIYIAIRVTLNPSLAQARVSVSKSGGKRRAMVALMPVIALITLVIGSMYSGFAGPSEAATLGVAGALAIATGQKSLTKQAFVEALFGAVRTTSMIGLIIVGAFFLSKAVAIFGIPTAVAETIAQYNLSPFGLIALLFLFYVLLGMILDGLSIIVMTLPIALPLVQDAGFSALWFGIFIVITVEMSQITPPIGFNLFIVRDLTGESIGRIARASLPFFLLMAGLAVLIVIFPDLVSVFL